MRIRLGPKGTHLVTALDVVVIVGVAATVVMALGARGRFSIGPVLLSLRDPLRPLLLAAFALVVRFAVDRRSRPLPSLADEELHSRLEEERVRLAAPLQITRSVASYAAVAAVGSLMWLTPHLLNIRNVPDAGDPIFSAWRLARFSHQLLTDPGNLFDGNILHPARHTLTYSDPTVLEGLVAFPFIALGADPLVVSNVLFLASFPLCAVAFFYAAWRLTSDPQAACVAGLLGGLSTFKIEHYSHLELQFFCFAPLAVILLLRMFAAPSWRSGALFGLTVTAQWLACMYLGIMLFVFLAPVALLATVAWARRPARPLISALAVGAGLVCAGMSVTAIPFLRSQADRGERSIDSVRYYSATPASYAAAHHHLATYRNFRSRENNLPERELFPGLLPLALGAVGVAAPVSLGTMAIMAGTAVAFDGSLGYNGLIYDELYTYVLPFRGMRVPARFAALVGTGLILLSAYGARRILRFAKSPPGRGAILIMLLAAAAIDVRPQVELQPYPSSVPPIYSAVTESMVLAELPMEDVANFSFMYFSTFHWARLINGETGYVPPSHSALEEDMEFFPDRDVLERLKARGATHLTVNCRLFSKPWRCPTLLERIGGMPELELLSQGKWQGAEVRLYAIR